MPSLMHSPSTISSTSQSSVSTSQCQRITTIASMLHFCRGRGHSKTISHSFSVPWPRSPSRFHHLRLQIPVLPAWHYSISELDTTCTKFLVSPFFPHMSEMFPSVPTHIIQPSAHPPSKCIPPALAHLAHPRSCTPRPIPHLHHHRRSASSCLTPHAFELRSSRLAQQQARQSPPVHLSLVLVPRVPGCPFSPASRSASAPPRNSLSIVCSSCPSRGARDDADAPRQPARARPVLRACASVNAPLYARALSTLPAFDAELLPRRQPARVLPTSRCPISSVYLLQRMTSHPPSLRALRCSTVALASRLHLLLTIRCGA
ncbi:hypothetical protein EDB83DRAFT_332584 [Lactarius deliciosus]|nr:hypothetical protein EDB83DRAFT_332584 [Lactarius deliciosus]